MNNDSENEGKNTKENKEAIGPENSEDENEAMENSQEGSAMEDGSFSDDYMPGSAASPKSNSACSIAEPELKEKGVDPLDERRKMREKWLSLTGRKPRNIPKIQKYSTTRDVSERIIFFGDRRPAQIEKERKQRWVQRITDDAYKKVGVNYGVVTREISCSTGSESIWSIRYHPKAENFISAFRNGGVQVRKPDTGEIIHNLHTLESFDHLPVRIIRYYPGDTNKVYLGGGSGIVQIFDLETASSIASGSHISQINNMDFSANGETLTTVGRNGLVYVLDAATLKVWDIRVRGAIRSINGPWICGNALDINGDTILTGSCVPEGSLQQWSFSTGKLLQTIPVYSRSNRNDGEYLYSAQYYNDMLGDSPSNPDVVAIGGSGFNEVILMKVSNSKILASFPAYKPIMALDTRANFIAYGGKETLLRVGQIHLPKRY
ncbi:hypothetical protein RUM44_008178 [Polyplax serrata]|uniref:Uncharacterized protein n=1 Tax=Polyplax serrata TaxID=468196 RepID=A0ABR1B7T7_POLSC